MLIDTEYGPDIETAVIKGRTPAAMDEAFRANMVATFQKVMGFLNAEAYNLRRHAARPLGPVQHQVHRPRQAHAPEAGGDRGRSLRRRAPSPRRAARARGSRGHPAVVDTLVTWGSPYAVPLRSNLAVYGEVGNLATSRAGARPVLLRLGVGPAVAGVAPTRSWRAGSWVCRPTRSTCSRRSGC